MIRSLPISMLKAICMLCITYLTISAQEASEIQTTRPKVGLALSGGGAKGFAHIGLLKLLDELGIRPDFITGTSMGSIVGGLYALGYTPAELESIISKQDWGYIFSNDIDLRLVNMMEKDDFSSHLLTLEYDDQKFTFDQGLIRGQLLDLMLARLASPAYAIRDFSQLPIPFSCVAVDVLTGSVVELDTGFLADAQRASMAIPVVFTPVQWGDRVLVDGGVIRNFPVQEVVNMGADIVIGAYTGREHMEADDVRSLVDILVQTNFLYGIKDSEEQADLCDYFLDLSGPFSASDFSEAKAIIDWGEAQAREQYPQLAALANSLNRLKTRDPIMPLHLPNEIYIEEVSTSDLPLNMRTLVRRLLDLPRKQTIPFSSVEDAVNRVYGTQFFKRTSYSLLPGSDGGAIVEMHAEDAPAANLRFGIHYNNPEKAGVIVKGRLNNLWNKAAVLEGKLKIAETPAVSTSFFQYFGKKKRLVYRFGLDFHKTDQHFLIPSLRQQRPFESERFTAFAALHWMYRNRLRTTLSYRQNTFKVEPIVRIDRDLIHFRQEGGEVRIGLQYDHVDRNYFPSQGGRFELNLGFHHNIRYDEQFREQDVASDFALAKPESYQKLSFTASWFLPMKDDLTLVPRVSIGLKSDPAFTDNFFLGGDYFYRSIGIPFVGLREFQRSYRSIGMAQLGIRWQGLERLYFTPIVNLALVQQDFPPLQIAAQENVISGAGITVGYDSFLGPIALTMGTSSVQEGPVIAFDMGYRFVF